jgi:ABC-2 type transport system ATP-binding protein
MLAVETTDLRKEYRQGFWHSGRKMALDGLNLAVEHGEILGLLGPNGAGKTTTLKLLFRLIFPTSGTARVLGRPLGDSRVHARIGYLPENPSFYDHLTAREFVQYAGWLNGLRRSRRRERAEELLNRVGLAESSDVPIRRFSKGMVQRVGIAQALVNDPDLVILDEPMSGLDPLGRSDVRDIILSLQRQGKTVLFSTHILSDAEALCDRVAILYRGRLQGVGSLSQILAASTASAELVLDDPSPRVMAALSGFTSTVVRTGERVRLELAPGASASEVLGRALAAGAQVVSFNPVKRSLEDYFMNKLAELPSALRSPDDSPLQPMAESAKKAGS